MPFIEQRDLREREIVPGFRGRYVHTEQMTIGFVDVDAGATLPEHAHPHEQITTVIAGELELTVDGQPRVLSPGTVAVIPSGVRHSGRAITACRVVDVFQPVRQDYR
jgi:quercetin dioxygenase-like cupin family protein